MMVIPKPTPVQLFLLILFLLKVSSNFCQNYDIVDFSIQKGRILNISEDILPNTLVPNYGFGASFKTSLKGASSPEHEWRNPSAIGVGIYHENYKNQVFGKSYRFLLLADFFPFQPEHLSKKLAASFNAGAGISYFDTKFDSINNLHNVLVGSDITFAFRVEARLAWNINEHFSLFSGYYLTHGSNGDWKLPNIGVNNVGFNGGLRLRHTHSKPLLNFKEYNIDNDRKYNLDLAITSALKAVEPTERNYLVAITQLNFSKKLNDFVHINSSLFYEVDWSLIRHMEAENNPRTAIDKLSITLGTELIWGKFSLQVRLGRYLYIPYDIFTTKIYQRYMLKLHVKEHIFLTGGLKSHAGKADFTEYGIGLRF